jgi:hypothetical protein
MEQTDVISQLFRSCRTRKYMTLLLVITEAYTVVHKNYDVKALREETTWKCGHESGRQINSK